MPGFEGKRAVVTGGAGFIGSHLVEELVQRGSYVVVLDDLSTGTTANLEHLPTGGLEFIRGSVTDIQLLQSLCTGADFVFHLAAIASVPRSIDKPGASHDVNLTGTLNVLTAAKDNGVKKVVFASSCAIYGNTAVLPTGEAAPPDPQSPYAVTKLAAEYYCDVFCRVYGLPTVCLRYFNVYGPRQSADSDYAAVIPKFIKKVAEGKPPVIYGDGKQSRDFVFVRDVAAANLLAADSSAAGVYNVGTGQSVDLNSLAETIINLSGSPVKAVHEPPRPGEVRHSRADISKALSLGFKPGYTLEAGLKQTKG